MTKIKRLMTINFTYSEPDDSKLTINLAGTTIAEMQELAKKFSFGDINYKTVIDESCN